jgi:hypothetical protein
MYVYEAEFPIDYFVGMTRLDDYIRLSYKNKDEYDYLDYLGLQKMLIKSFMAVKCSVAGWEGDIRGNDIFISAIPSLDNTTLKLLAFKQDNNGTSFIVSDFPLPTDEHQFELKKLQDKLKSYDMMEYFEGSFKLTMDIITKATKNIPPEVNIVRFEDLKELVSNHENNKKEEVKEVKVNTASNFDMSNYQKI